MSTPAFVLEESNNADALKSGASELKNRFEQEDWKAAEQPVNDFTRCVFTCLKEYASGKQLSSVSKALVLGENFYCAIRDSLYNCEFQLVPKKPDLTKKNEKNKNKNQKKKGMTADEIRFENSKKKITEFVDELLSSFKKNELTCTFGLETCKYLELRGVTLMYCCWFLLNHIDKFRKTSGLESAYELIVAVQKFIQKTIGYVGKSVLNESTNETLSITMINDLKYWLNLVLTDYPFDGQRLCAIAPRLLIFTKYDNAIPTTGISPRQNQVDIITTIKSQMDTGFFISYKAMVASGKTTTAAICIPQMIHDINVVAKSKNQPKKYELIACCNIRSVKDQMANSAYNAGIKFGVAYISIKNGIKIVKIINHNTTTNADRDLIICSPDAAYLLLIEEEQRVATESCDNRYWFFLDEPTIGADHYGSESLLDNMRVLQHAPPRTILSSATMCELDKIPNIVEYQKKKYPSIYIGTIYSNEIQIGCNLRTFDNERVLPHLGCKSCTELRKIVDAVIKNPFLGRLYTTQTALLLWEKLDSLKIKGLVDIKTLFNDINNLVLDKVRQTCMDMLLLLANTTDDLVKQVCSSKITELNDDNSSDESEEDNSDIQFEEVVEKVPKNISFPLFGTTQAHRFMNMNLIVDTNPLEFALTNFGPLLDIMKNEYGCDSAAKLYAKYERDKSFFEKKYTRLDERIKNEEDRSKQQQEIQENYDPVIAFPEECKINTLAHINKFAKKAKINSKEIRTSHPLELIPFYDCLVPDWVMLLLFAGVGIYSPINSQLNETYNNTVLHMAATGSLAYLISDAAICYGTNYPIYRVFITEQFAQYNSINTLFQLLGRAGRVGQSWSAEAFIGNSIALELLKYVKDESDSAFIEAKNMERTFQNFVQPKIVKEEEKPEIDWSGKIKFIANSKTEHIVPISEIQKKYNKKKESINSEIKSESKSNSESINWRNRDMEETQRKNIQIQDQKKSEPVRSSNDKNYSRQKFEQKDISHDQKTTDKKIYVPPFRRGFQKTDN